MLSILVTVAFPHRRGGERVKAAYEKLVERHPKVPRLGDHWVADPALRSELLQLVTDCPWTEAEILECFLSLRKRSAL